MEINMEADKSTATFAHRHKNLFDIVQREFQEKVDGLKKRLKPKEGLIKYLFAYFAIERKFRMLIRNQNHTYNKLKSANKQVDNVVENYIRLDAYFHSDVYKSMKMEAQMYLQRAIENKTTATKRKIAVAQSRVERFKKIPKVHNYLKRQKEMTELKEQKTNLQKEIERIKNATDQYRSQNEKALNNKALEEKRQFRKFEIEKKQPVKNIEETHEAETARMDLADQSKSAKWADIQKNVKCEKLALNKITITSVAATLARFNTKSRFKLVNKVVGSGECLSQSEPKAKRMRFSEDISYQCDDEQTSKKRQPNSSTHLVVKNYSTPIASHFLQNPTPVKGTRIVAQPRRLGKSELKTKKVRVFDQIKYQNDEEQEVTLKVSFLPSPIVLKRPAPKRLQETSLNQRAAKIPATLKTMASRKNISPFVLTNCKTFINTTLFSIASEV